MRVDEVSINLLEQLLEEAQAESLALQVFVYHADHFVILIVEEFLPPRDKLDVVALFGVAHQEL